MRPSPGIGHVQVDHDEVGLELLGQKERLGAVLGLADDLQAGVFEQVAQALAEEVVIVGEYDPQTGSGRIHWPNIANRAFEASAGATIRRRVEGESTVINRQQHSSVENPYSTRGATSNVRRVLRDCVQSASKTVKRR